MRRLTQFFERFLPRLNGAIALTGHVVLVHDDCPHCDARTLCEVSALHRHYRCLECGRSIREQEEQVEALRREEDKDLVVA
jgi:DNA-directed RNA polymerase subunit RPC12/RpoP